MPAQPGKRGSFARWQKQTSHIPSFDLAYLYQTFRNLFPTSPVQMWESVIPTQYKMSAWAGEVISILSGCLHLKSLSKLITDDFIRSDYWGSKKTLKSSWGPSTYLTVVVFSLSSPSYEKATHCSITHSTIAVFRFCNSYQQNIMRRRWNKYNTETVAVHSAAN